MSDRTVYTPGDFVKIIHPGQRYTTYSRFFLEHCPEFRDGYDYEDTLYIMQTGDIASVVFAKYDEYHDMYVIEFLDYPGQYYLVNNEAIEPAEYSQNPALIEIDEAEMMSLIGVISCS